VHYPDTTDNKTGIDEQVCFYRRPVFDPVKSRRTIMDPVRLLRGINGVAWGPILSHCTAARLVVWWGLYCGHLSGPLCTQLGRLCLKASLTHPPSPSPPPPARGPPLTCGIRDISGSAQNKSQNQPVHPVAM